MLKLYPALILATFLLLNCSNSDDKDSVYTCNGIEYAPPYQTCEGGILKIQCGNNYYNPATQFCSEQDNLVYDKCNGKGYNSLSQKCEESVVLSKCEGKRDEAYLEYCTGKFVDERDSITYKYVRIGTQVWMAENLNYNARISKCYGEDREVWDYETGKEITLTASEIQDNCKKYGRLYNWEIASTACPAGWHLPDEREWNILINYVGGYSVAGGYLKATSGWKEGGNGLDMHGFAALPGGYVDDDGDVDYIGRRGRWSISSTNYISMNYNMEDAYSGYSRSNYYDRNMYSVRCIKD
jgi:uncharacterized protein (TIGR02145 family)